ncbi:2-dehydro-3-deoxygalactonokinase [Vannielia litorea]|uniref:2-keto-3-deoxygalactonate kinase n=1 Tax=Vannielia litorea TaxID=1217970 RepID=A0A1N6IH32_9RHOB|nr:2-dehydro-3-deoxygalactonokinase [Vannielia litorea]SIO31311.1 2-keto-3-deoxygalactonate kinase [Vannielia litorea]
MIASWIAADWGTSNLRLWAIGPEGEVIGRASSNKGMGKLDPSGYEPVLLELAEPWLGRHATDVLICGMAGARQGWVEAPYAAAPCKPAGLPPVSAPTDDPRLRVRILPGVSQSDPADVMRGEETQVAGFLAGNPAFDGILCLPGTHSKWVHVSAGEIVSFRTFMTGELFSLLSSQSVLRHALHGEGWDESAFAQAAAVAMSRPERLASSLFSLRAASLLTGLAPGTARARLSGTLIGLELAAARPYWLGQRVALIGGPLLTEPYAKALAAQGLAPEIHDGENLALAGLTAARMALA